MIRKHVFLSQKQIDNIQELADKHGLRWAEMLRRVIDEGIRREVERGTT